MALNYNALAVQQVFNIDCFDLEDGSLDARLDALKNTTWANNGQIVYAQGGVGNTKIIGFGHSKESSLEATSAIINDGTWGMQTGSGVKKLTNTKLIQYSEVISCGTANEVTTTFKATGTAGSEIMWAYKVDAYGATIQKFKQSASTASEGTFQYATETKKLTFNSGEVSVGDRILVFYHPNVKEAAHVENRTDKFAKTIKVVANTVFLDTCTGKSYIGQLVYDKAKVSEETSFDLTADGEPAVQNLKLEGLRSCSSAKLWDLYIFDEADIADEDIGG